MFRNKYPYTDFHELNLDWLIHEVRKLNSDVKMLSKKIDAEAENIKQLKKDIESLVDEVETLETMP